MCVNKINYKTDNIAQIKTNVDITITECLLQVCIFTCAVVVEHLCKDSRVTVEEILVKYSVIVGLRLCETRQSSSWNLLQCGAVDLMPYSTNVDTHSVAFHRGSNR